MPKLQGVFDRFADLDKVNAQDLAKWLKSKGEVSFLENFLGNKLLYPQTVSVKKTDFNIDVAIFLEAVRLSPGSLYDQKGKKIIIPVDIVKRFPPLTILVDSLIHVLSLPEGQTTVFLKTEDKKLEILGTVVRPPAHILKENLKVILGTQVIQARVGTILRIAATAKALQLNIDTYGPLGVSGGGLGVVLDLRGAENVR